MLLAIALKIRQTFQVGGSAPRKLNCLLYWQNVWVRLPQLSNALDRKLILFSRPLYIEDLFVCFGLDWSVFILLYSCKKQLAMKDADRLFKQPFEISHSDEINS